MRFIRKLVFQAVNFSPQFMGIAYLCSVWAVPLLLSGCNLNGSVSQIQDGFLGGIHLSTARSLLSVSSTTVLSGSSVTITLTTRDQNGKLFWTQEAPSIQFSLIGGTSQGTFSSVTDHGDGIYTATFTGTTAGTADQVLASVNGTPLISLAPSIRVLLDLSISTSSVTASSSTVTYSGTCTPGLTITISGAQSSSTTCSTSGTWSWTSSSISSDGNYSFTFTETDTSGNSASSAGTYDRDATAPNAVSSFLDGNTTNDTAKSPLLSWDATTDPGPAASGIDHYELAIGTSAGGTDVVNWTDVGNTTSYQFTGLSLTNGNMYYGSIKAIDKAGNVSNVTQGDGFSVVTETPTLAFNFLSGSSPMTSTNTSYPTIIQFSRASGTNVSPGTYFNSSGALVMAPENLFTHSQDFSAGWWPGGLNPFGSGSVQNTPATAAPDGTSTAAFIQEDTSTSQHDLEKSVTLTPNATYTVSIYAKAGTASYIDMVQYDSTDGNMGEAHFDLSNGTMTLGSGKIISVGNGWYRCSMTFTPTVASSSFFLKIYDPSWNWNYTGDGTSGLYIWGAQLEQGSSATSYIYTTNAPAYGPRFDYDPAKVGSPRGLLIEDQKTNVIRNNTMQGASVGSPGTPPTNWSIYGTTGTIVSSIVATGTEAGIPYIDVNFAGTSGGAISYPGILFESTTDIPAVQNQTWSASSYVKLSGGSLAGISAAYIEVVEYDSSGTYLTNHNVAFTPTNSGLATQRAISSVSLTNASTAYVSGQIAFNIPANTAINVTLRIGMPQLEQGSFPTSVIPTSGTAMTRSADVATVPSMSSWYNTTAGTLYSSFIVPYLNPSGTGTQFLANFSDGTLNNRIGPRFNGGTLAGVTVTGGSMVTALGSWTTYTTGSLGQTAMAYQDSNFGESFNGSAASVTSSGSVPTVNTFSLGDLSANGGGEIDGWLQSIEYYNTRMSNSAIQELTHP